MGFMTLLLSVVASFLKHKKKDA
ncbi:hypothetical protein [Lactococcus sp. DD01]